MTPWTPCQALLTFTVSWICSDSHPLSWWCHPIISSSAIPFSFFLQSCPLSGSFSINWLFASGGQSIGALASATVLPVNIQGWFLLGLTGLILLSKGLSSVFSSTTVQKHQFFGAQSSLWSNSLTSVHDYWKTIGLTRWTFVGKVMSLLFNTLSWFVICFQGANVFLISWLQSLSTVILEPKKITSITVPIFFPVNLPWSDGTRCHDLCFLNVEF